MAWPFARDVRAYMRLIFRWLDQGKTREWIRDWFRTSPHGYDVAASEKAVPEEQRARYFAEQLREAPSTRTFGQSWFIHSRATFRQAYGRLATAEERYWAYSQPEQRLGLMLAVSGLGLYTGQPRNYTIPVNVSWQANMDQLEAYIREQVSSAQFILFRMGTEPLDPDSVEIDIIGGALVARQPPVLEMP